MGRSSRPVNHARALIEVIAKKGAMTVYCTRHNPPALARIVFLLVRDNKLFVLNPRYARLNYSLISFHGE